MSVTKLPNGRWQARWRDDTGHQRARNFAYKADAVAHLQTSAGTAGPDDRLTVTRMADLWLDSARNLGNGGRDTYRRDLDTHIIPALGDLPLRRLTAERIDDYLTAKTLTHAPSTVHRHYRTIRRLCAVAVTRGHLTANPCDKVTPPRIPHTEMRYLDVTQLEHLATTIGARYRCWVLVAGWGGLRWSETVGLRRTNVDGARVTVAEQLIRRPSGEWERRAPKTRAGRRTVTLPASVAVELADHLDRWSLAGPDGLVFPNQRGAPIGAASFSGNVWKPALRRASLDTGLRPHDLRHTAVALAIASGAHPKAIQARMGHASIAVTLDRYGHLFPALDEDLAVRLDGMRSSSS